MKTNLLVLMVSLVFGNALAQTTPCPLPPANAVQEALLFDGSEDTLDAAARAVLLDQVVSTIRDNHVNPNVGGAGWLEEGEKLRSNIMVARNDAGFYQQLRDLVALLKDHHTQFLSPAQTKMASATIAGQENYYGLGMSYSLNRLNQMQLTWVFPGSPAENAGLKIGDTILSANQKPCPTAVDIRGPEGTEVVLEVLSPGKALRKVTGIRGPVQANQPRLITRLQNNTEIVYVRIDSFFEHGIGLHVRRKIHEALRQGEVKGMVLDLRQNVGGLYQETNDFLSSFLPDGQVISVQKGRDGAERLRQSALYLGDPEPIDLPMAVLIGPVTSSGGELAAEVLRKHKGAVVLGQPSANALSTAFWHDLQPSGARVRVTGELMFLSDGTPLGIAPVQPDVLLPDALPLLPDQDPGVARAIEILLKQ